MNYVLEKLGRAKEKVSDGATRMYCGLKCESGQGISEYIIILAVIVIVCIALAIAFRGQLVGFWERVNAEFKTI